MTQSWDPAWEKVFSTREWGKYPPEELIRFIARGFYRAPDRKAVKILDAGCGTGACSWYVAREGFSIFGVDGSPTALKKAQTRFSAEGLTGCFIQGDLNKIPFPDSFFDAVFEVAAVQQNRVSQIHSIISEIRRVLKPRGRLFSMFLKEGSWGDNMGISLEPHTFTEIPDGPYYGLGTTHYATESEILEFFEGFADLEIEVSARTYNSRAKEVAHWVISATR